MHQATARAERLARNDAAFRAANERIDEVAKSVDDYRDTLLRGTRRTKRRASSKTIATRSSEKVGAAAEVAAKLDRRASSNL